MVKKKKYPRNYPNNPKKDIMEKKIPFNASVKRKVVLDFETVCFELGLEKSPMVEELLLTFIKDVKKAIKK